MSVGGLGKINLDYNSPAVGAFHSRVAHSSAVAQFIQLEDPLNSSSSPMAIRSLGISLKGDSVSLAERCQNIFHACGQILGTRKKKCVLVASSFFVLGAAFCLLRCGLKC